MKYLLIILILFMCKSKNSSIIELSKIYNTSVNDPILSDPCLFLNLIDEDCQPIYNEKFLLRVHIKKCEIGSEIFTFKKLDRDYVEIAYKLMDSKHDNIFNIVNEKLPIEYSFKKKVLKKIKYDSLITTILLVNENKKGDFDCDKTLIELSKNSHIIKSYFNGDNSNYIQDLVYKFLLL